MKYLRTDDARFEGLPDYRFQPNYIFVDDTEGGQLRLHYIDVGSHGDQVVLCLHGEPTWSFVYRKMIKILVGAGFRVIAPDLIGFGRSDKPTECKDYTYQRHVDWVDSTLDQLQLDDVNLFCHDWGGLIGLRVVGKNVDRFRRVIVSNTALPTGAEGPSEAFLSWRRLSQEMTTFPVGALINNACTTRLSDAVIGGYDAPFPDELYKAGVRQFPVLVPISEDDPASEPNRLAWDVLRNFERPWLTIFSNNDPLTKDGEKVFQRRVKGAQGQPHVLIKNAGHFLQEDKGEEVARAVVDFIRLR